LLDFKVSVIIPVFNVAEYLINAVKSATSLEEVGEVILVEDGSLDCSKQICLDLAKQLDKVKVIFHDKNENRGVSESRNLGIENSKFPYIAFLDADDWYLPNRFKKDKTIFLNRSDVGSVYSCSIIVDSAENYIQKYGVNSKSALLFNKLETPLAFYEKKVQTNAILFNTNSFTIRKVLLQKEKKFDKRLTIHEDIEFYNRLMRFGKFVAGEWNEPVAVVRRHSGNSIRGKNRFTILKMIAVHIDNISIDSLYDFEVKDLYERIWRRKSERFNKSWIRRFYFYFYYYFNFFHKKSFLKKVKSTYATH
jgi:glycosyltransferase involved in cell wall biosynthesis